jgi:hypothetical protein
MLGAHAPVITCMSFEKPRRSVPGHLLVDDRASLRGGWQRKGGRFIHHVSAKRGIVALRAVGIGGGGHGAPRQPSGIADTETGGTETGDARTGGAAMGPTGRSGR